MHVVIVHGALSPYHLARMAAAEQLAQERSWQLTTVERVGRQTEYPLFGGITGPEVTLRRAYAPEQPTPSDKESVFQLRNLLTELEPDCVVFGRSSPVYFSVLQWCLTQKLPTVLLSDSTVYDYRRSAWKEWIKGRIIQLFSAGFVAGIRQQDYMVSLGVPAGVITQGYDVVDNLHFSLGADAARLDSAQQRLRLGLPDQYFLVSSRLIEKKNLLRVFDAYGLYVQQQGSRAWDLVVVGDGPLKSLYEEKIAALGLADQVLLTGYRGYQDLPAYYGLANAFILGSSSDQWGLVVNEAMAAGLPVLVSDRCGCSPDLVRPGVNGFVFDPFDVLALATFMARLSGDEVDLSAMGQASREIIAHWTPERFAHGLLTAVEHALSAPRRKIGMFDRMLLKALCPA